MTADAAAWNAWTTVTPVAAAPANRPRFVRVRLPLAVNPGPDGEYADLRVVDDRGAETPYAIDPQHAPPDGLRAVRMVDTGFVPHRYTQAVLDLGNGPAADTVMLQVDTPKLPTYLERVTIEASDDRKTWRIVRDGAIVYDVADDGGRGNQTVRFPESSSRWLRVRVADPQRPFPLSGALVSDTHGAQPAAPALVPLAVAAVAGNDAAAHRQVWTFEDRGVALRPSAVAFTDGGATFARHALVESSDDGTTWAQVADGEITRFAEGGAQTSFAFGESSARRWRVVVENGDDAPVPGLHPALLARPRDVVFEAAPQRRYRLLSGNDGARPPAYDLGTRLAHSTWRADPAFAVQARRNEAYSDQRSGTERAPGALTGVLLAVAVALGALAVLTMRGAKKA
ncbi:MAG TPA: DUF3999 family protein [Dongiaceae bacterium]|nr:DUF3999 family protein [Dongiaceae bacterium]